MLIRFIVKNLFSFKEETEFNLLPGRPTRLNHHKYERNGLNILKQTAIYGANGSGKSNLVKALAALQQMVTTGIIPYTLNTQKFKLAKSTQAEPVELGIEFFCNDAIYFYTISIHNGIITDEYFGESGVNRDKLIFKRTTTINKVSTIIFFDGFEDNKENLVLKDVIEKSLIKPQQPLFFLLNEINANADANAFSDIYEAFQWIKYRLILISPDTHPSGFLVHAIDTQNDFGIFVKKLMCSFNTGINDLKIGRGPIEDYVGKENEKEMEEIRNELKNNPEGARFVPHNFSNEEIAIVNENGNIIVKRLLFPHKGEKNEDVDFAYIEESDGTKRLLEFTPAFYQLVNDDATYIIDEMERSLHPTIIKELISKFSHDEHTKGQLIFTTHESNLLDQDIFRTDEIWFAEKGIDGATKLYSLSDFKEHNTIDIRKGYLTGRYGAIPFLGNLHDLNWNNTKENA